MFYRWTFFAIQTPSRPTAIYLFFNLPDIVTLSGVLRLSFWISSQSHILCTSAAVKRYAKHNNSPFTRHLFSSLAEFIKTNKKNLRYSARRRSLRRSRSFKVTDVSTNRKLICDFLLVNNTNLPLVSHRQFCLCRVHFVIIIICSCSNAIVSTAVVNADQTDRSWAHTSTWQGESRMIICCSQAVGGQLRDLHW